MSSIPTALPAEYQQVVSHMLWQLRDPIGSPGYEGIIDMLCDIAERHNLSLEDLGTSEEELEKLKDECAHIELAHWLESSKIYRRPGELKGRLDPRLNPRGALNRAARSLGIAIEDDGPIPDAAFKAAKRGNQLVVDKSLRAMRESDFYCSLLVEKFEDNVAKLGKSLAEVGVSDEEMASFRRRAKLDHVKSLLQTFRRWPTSAFETDVAASSVASFRTGLKELGLSLEQIGTTEEELAGFANPTS